MSQRHPNPAASGPAPPPTREPPSYPSMRIPAVLAVGFVVTTAFHTGPRPGAHGQHLAVTAALVLFAAGTIAAVRFPSASPTTLTPLLLTVVLSAAALIALQPAGPGVLGLFPAVAAAALRLPARPGIAIAATAVMGLALASGIGAHRPASGVVLNEFGVVAFYLLATFVRRYQEISEQAKAMIVELEETRAAQARAAALGERQRLAREMHDVLAHSLSGLLLNLEGARLLAEHGHVDARITDAIGRAHRLARTGLEEARRAIGMLRDDALPGPTRLTELAAQFETDTGVACTLTVDGAAHALGSDSQLTLYRVAQEALTNTRKHASARRVEIGLTYETAGTRLRVEDIEDVATNRDRPPPGDGTGYGLTGMRERAELLGATLRAGPTHQGFLVELWIPVGAP